MAHTSTAATDTRRSTWCHAPLRRACTHTHGHAHTHTHGHAHAQGHTQGHSCKQPRQPTYDDGTHPRREDSHQRELHVHDVQVIEDGEVGLPPPACTSVRAARSAPTPSDTYIHHRAQIDNATIRKDRPERAPRLRELSPGVLELQHAHACTNHHHDYQTCSIAPSNTIASPLLSHSPAPLSR